MLASIKDQLSMELTTKSHLGLDSINPEEGINDKLTEPLTAGTVLNKGSMGTLESEFTADNSFMT